MRLIDSSNLFEQSKSIYKPQNHSLGPLAQLVEHLAFNQRVAGSSPARLIYYSGHSPDRFLLKLLSGILYWVLIYPLLRDISRFNFHRSFFRQTQRIYQLWNQDSFRTVLAVKYINLFTPALTVGPRFTRHWLKLPHQF